MSPSHISLFFLQTGSETLVQEDAQGTTESNQSDHTDDSRHVFSFSWLNTLPEQLSDCEKPSFVYSTSMNTHLSVKSGEPPSVNVISYHSCTHHQHISLSLPLSSSIIGFQIFTYYFLLNKSVYNRNLIDSHWGPNTTLIIPPILLCTPLISAEQCVCMYVCTTCCLTLLKQFFLHYLK